jgi:hypothetical protein
MAKVNKDDQSQTTENVTTESQNAGGEAGASPVTPTPETNGGASQTGVVLSSGERRVDYIKRQYMAGYSRGEISKQLTTLQGKKVPYQVVFQVTKKMKPEEIATAEANAKKRSEAAAAQAQQAANEAAAAASQTAAS